MESLENSFAAIHAIFTHLNLLLNLIGLHIQIGFHQREMKKPFNWNIGKNIFQTF